MFKLITKIAVIICVLICLIFVGYWHQFLHEPIQLQSMEMLIVKPGATVKQIAYQLHSRKIIRNAKLFHWFAWYRGEASKIQAGEYLIEPAVTPRALLQKIVNGRVAQYSFTIVPGWSFKQLLQALHQEKKIIHTLQEDNYKTITDKFIAICTPNKLITTFTNLEGIFWPDTYLYTADTTDLEFLHRAYDVMYYNLQQEWNSRDVDLKINNSYEALILASIVEREASVQDEYFAIAGVYHNRLQQNIFLQADPTVIYAWQQKKDFQMPLKKSDLKIQSAYNTYRHTGLPPTPIGIPSLVALHATLHPAISDALYFVANGNREHVFSATLQEHNKAVANYRKLLLRKRAK